MRKKSKYNTKVNKNLQEKIEKPGRNYKDIQKTNTNDNKYLSRACQAPLSMRISRQESWSGLPFPSPGDLPNQGIESRPPTMQVDSLPTELLGKPYLSIITLNTNGLMVQSEDTGWQNGLKKKKNFLYAAYMKLTSNLKTLQIESER